MKPETERPTKPAPDHPTKPAPDHPTKPAPAQPADNADSTASALRAVQVALDRRDNGGDTATADPRTEYER
jgi:hypothetical protein